MTPDPSHDTFPAIAAPADGGFAVNPSSPRPLPNLAIFGVQAAVYWLLFFGPRRLPKPDLARKG